MIEWVAKRFPTCQVLIGDSIHRITLELRDKVTKNQAEKLALELGQDFIINNTDIIKKFGANTHFEFIKCSEIQKTAQYQNFHSEIPSYFNEKISFKKPVETFSRNYHKNIWNIISEEEREYRVKRSCDYFLEEFAVFSCLVKSNNNVMAYPGSFSTLTEIAQGRFPGIGKELEALTVVSLQLKKR